MDPIPVPKPQGVRDPNRPAGTLLLSQVHHLHKAEKDLPPKYHSGIFHKAIATEDDAARYIRAVTHAIHKAHDDAAKERRLAARNRVIRTAAEPARHPARKTKAAKGKKEKLRSPLAARGSNA